MAELDKLPSIFRDSTLIRRQTRDDRTGLAYCVGEEHAVFRDGRAADRYVRTTRSSVSLPNIDYIPDPFYTQFSHNHSARATKPLGPEQCIKCMLRVLHKLCEAHKFIRIGGGYRHSYSYLKALMGDALVEFIQKEFEQQHLAAIEEDDGVQAVRTFIRTKSGKLVERVVFMSAVDYNRFVQASGEGVHVLNKYLSKEEANNLDSWDQEQVKAIKTFVRSKSGKLKEKLVYVSKSDYDGIKTGKMDAGSVMAVLRKYVKKEAGERIDGWGDAQMKQVKTQVRTRSGRIVEKVLLVSKEELQQLQAGDPQKVLSKYIGIDQKVEGWHKAKVTVDNTMKVIKTTVRTKSGRKVEKTVVVTEKEYQMLQQHSDDKNTLRKLLKLSNEDVMEDWVKESSAFGADDSEDERILEKATAGEKIISKDGIVFEVIVDPKTGKKLKRKVSGGKGTKKSRKAGRRKKRVKNGDESDASADSLEQIKYEALKQGKRNDSSESEFSYHSVHSNGGTRKVLRQRRHEDGAHSSAHSYHSSEDEAGKHRRNRRRKKRKEDGEESAESLYSVVSEGGTRKIQRRNVQNVVSSSEESGEDQAQRRRRGRRKPKPELSDSEQSDVTPGGTYIVGSADGERVTKHRRRHTRTKEELELDDELENGMAKDVRRRGKTTKGKKRSTESDSSHISEDGKNQYRKKERKKKQPIHDASGKILGYESDEASSSSDYDSEVSESEYESFEDEAGRRVVVKVKSARKVKKSKETKGRLESADRDPLISGRKRNGVSKAGKKRNAGLHHIASPGGTRYVEPEGGFSEDSTATEDEPDIQRMTEREQRKYVKDKAERKAAREKLRREKYGEEYEEVLAQHEANKKETLRERVEAHGLQWDSDDYEANPKGYSQTFKSMVTYSAGADRGLHKETRQDSRAVGLPHTGWIESSDKKDSKMKLKVTRVSEDIDDDLSDEEGTQKEPKRSKGKKGKVKRQYDADNESSESESGAEGVLKKANKAMKPPKDGKDKRFAYTLEYDEKGQVKKKKKVYSGGESGSEYEVQYDEKGKVKRQIRVKDSKYTKQEPEPSPRPDSDDGKYFEKGENGQLRMIAGKSRIDLAKLNQEDLKALGVDSHMTQRQIAHHIRDKFGQWVNVAKGKLAVIGTKELADYASDANTDDLADDSDLDTWTVAPGKRRVHILMKKGGAELQEYVKRVVAEAELTDTATIKVSEETSTDFLSAFRLVDKRLVEGYAQAFVVEDEKKSGKLPYKVARYALEGIPSMSGISAKQFQYVMKVLDIPPGTEISFRMFGVIASLCERVTRMDSQCQALLQVCDLVDVERKLQLYKMMFFCNSSGDCNSQYITCESLMIELIAGGLSWQQQDYVMSQLQPNKFREISFLDYLVYIPLFLSMHDTICYNPLDMSLSKFGASRQEKFQRDLNPLTCPLKLTSAYVLRQQAENLLAGKVQNIEPPKQDVSRILGRHQKLPDVIRALESRPPGAPRYL